MKKTNIIILTAVLIIVTCNLVAQTQLPKWPLNGKEVDFINNQVNTINQSLTSRQYTSNGYYDEQYGRLFHIVDTAFWWGDGTYEGPLFVDEHPVTQPDYMFPEMLVLPKDTLACAGDFYVFYGVRRAYEREIGKSFVVDLQYSVMYNTVTPDDEYLSGASEIVLQAYSTNNEVALGIAATDFLPGTNTRRVYIVYYNMGTNTNYIKFVNVTPTGVSSPYTVASFSGNTKVLEPNEVEISRDRTKLIFTRPKTFQPNSNDYSNDLTIVHLNPSTGYLNTAGGTNGYTYVDFGTQNSYSDKYVGCEFNAAEDYIYVTDGSSGLYKYEISTGIKTLVSYTSAIANSQLEYSRDGYIYGIDANGQLFSISSNGTFAQSQLPQLGSSAVISNSYYGNGVTTRTLPDQIDGYAYDDYWGDEDYCCYYNNESENVRTLNNVTFDSEGNITISGAGSSWSAGVNPFTPSGFPITDVYLKGSINIDTDASLTISGLTLHFKEDEGINMTYTFDTNQEGSKLYLVSNAKLTAFDECDEDALWRGIICEGHWTLSQTPYYDSQQPYIYMNNSTIEFAELGIDAGGGGIVRTYSANFKDNLIDVSFVGSDNFYQTVLSNTNFFTTSALYAKGYNPQYHAHLWMGDGVIFKGCDFYNNYGYLNGISSSNWGLGILATLSNIIVQEYSTTNSSFEHLYYGIKLSQGESFLLQNSNFTDCLRGVWAANNDGISITGCDFDVYYYNGLSMVRNAAFGLNLESCTGYLVTENTFRDGVNGVVMYNSGENHNEIYKNNFENIYGIISSGTSLQAIGLNTGYPDKIIGLQVKCNNFDDVDYSIYVTGGNIYEGTSVVQVTVYESDIAQHQYVKSNGLYQDCAMNYWTNMPTPNNDNRYFYVNPSHSDIVAHNERYIYHCPSTTGYFLPDGSFNTNYVSRDVMTPTETCPSIRSRSESSSIPELLSKLEELEQQENETTIQFDELISYNELDLEISAQTANSLNSTDVFNDLNENSPVLTANILLAYLNNYNVSELSKVSLLVANSPLPKVVIEAVQHSNLKSEYKAYIMNFQDGENQIEALKNQADVIKGLQQSFYDNIVRVTLISDTTESFDATYNMVLDYLETKTDLHAKKRLADMYSQRNMYFQSNETLDELEYIATNEENTALFNYVQIKRLQNNVKQTHSMEDAQNAIRNNEEFLRELAADYNTKEGGAARAMLESAGLWDNFPIVFLPNPEQTMEDRSAKVNNYEDSQELIPELESLFSIYPNPADNYLSIEFINPEGNCTFSIFTIKGDLVKTVSTNQQLGFMSIDISNLEAGNYIINCKELNSSQSFMIVR